MYVIKDDGTNRENKQCESRIDLDRLVSKILCKDMPKM